jgi:hypothetical protein
MTTQKVLVYAAVLGTAFSGCKKEETVNAGPTPVSTSAQNSVRQWCDQNLANAAQNFTLNATTGGMITGSGGTRVLFLPGSLRNNGVPVSGTVEVELVEVLNVADMVMMNKQTLGNDNGTLKMLSSGGEVKITATQGGQELDIVANGAIVGFPGRSYNPGMEAFTGTEDEDGNVVWERTTDPVSIVVDTTVVDTAGVDWFWYTWETDSLEWLNCDYFPPGTTTALDVDVPDGYDNSNTMVWLVVPDLNGVLGSYPSGLNFMVWQAPIGYGAVVVALHEENGSYLSSFTPITVASGMTVPITFSSTTLAQFEADLDAL